MPSYYLKEAGVTPASSIYTGSHDATVDAVINAFDNVIAHYLKNLYLCIMCVII